MRDHLLGLLRYGDCFAKLAVDLGEDAGPLERLKEEVDEDGGVRTELLGAVQRMSIRTPK